MVWEEKNNNNIAIPQFVYTTHERIKPDRQGLNEANITSTPTPIAPHCN